MRFTSLIRTATLLAFCLFALCYSPGLAQKAGDALLALMAKEQKPLESLLPQGVTLVGEYKESGDNPVGLIDYVENEAYVIHSSDAKNAYKAQKTKPVYQGDTLIAQPSSSLVVLLNDMSKFTVAANSKAIIDKSVYSEEKNFRDTSIQLLEGKGRFVVKKMKDVAGENFKVETPVATCGFRGSDVVIALAPVSEVNGLQLGWLDRLFSASSALAQPPRPNFSMLVLAGPSTSLVVQGRTGPPVYLESNSVTAAFADRPCFNPLAASPERALDMLKQVGPTISVMSMPGEFE